MASIKSTAYPKEPLSLVEWLQYIGHLKGNTVRPGGLNYSEYQEQTLEAAKLILSK